MNKTLLENRKLAAVVLAVVVVLSIFGIGTVKTKSVGKVALEYYQENMAADFAARENAAESILTIAAQVGVDASLIEPAQDLLEDSRKAVSAPAQRYRASEKLKLSVELVYNSIPAESRDAKGSAVQMAWSEFTSRTAILSHSIPEYNTQARTAAKKFSGFPAGMLASFAGAQVEEMTA